MGIHRHSYRPEPPQQGPHRDYGWSSSNAGGPFLYRPPDGQTWKVYSVVFVNGKMFRTDTRRRIQPTHRAFVAEDGRRLFVAFTDSTSCWSAPRTLYEQLAVAVPREALLKSVE
jgi:hypothetical protein